MKSKLLFLAALIPLLGGCGSNETPAEPGSLENRIYTIVDIANIASSVKDYKRVVCLGAGALRYYSYIGDLNKLIAVEDIDSASTFGVGQAIRPYYDANKEKFSTLGSTGKGGPGNQEPTMEKLMLLEPDIVVSFYSPSKTFNAEMVEKLECPVISLSQGTDGVFDETTLNSFRLLGKVFNRTDKANKLINYINSQKNLLANLTVSNDNYYAGCIGNWGKTSLYGTYKDFPVFKYAKVSSFVDDLSDLVSNTQATITSEALIDGNPDKIFVDSAGFNNFIADYKANKDNYTSLDAISNGEVYCLMPYNAYYTNLEVQLMSTFYVASIAHKEDELFKNMNIEDKYNEILENFVSKRMYNELSSRDDALGGYTKLDLEELAK